MWLVLTALWFQTPSLGATESCVDTLVPQNITHVRLYRADCGGSPWYLVRQKTTVTAHFESLEVDTVGCMTYDVRTVNALGKESCPAMISFPRAVAVEPIPGRGEPELFDLAGRRVRLPAPPGIYFERVGHRKRMVVIRK